jgi:hypothetical protein
MKALYINSISSFSGKTALCLGLGLYLQNKGVQLGYMKPVSKQGFRVGADMVDEDAEFVKRVLRLETPVNKMSPIVVTDELLDDLMAGRIGGLWDKVEDAFQIASEGKDFVLLEGGADMQEGFAFDLSPIGVARHLKVPVLSMVRWRDEGVSGVLDDAFAARHRLQNDLLGVIINNVPEKTWDAVNNKVAPYLESKGIRVYGILPHKEQLMAISVGELIDLLQAEVLTGGNMRERLIESLAVGAMTFESALPRFRRQINKAVITGGDRTDLQAAALETSTVCLVLTGNLHPSATIVKHAEELGVAVLLVPDATIDALEKIESVFGRTRLGQAEKLNRFQAMLAEYLNFERLMADLHIG